jgi:hypothetical protein
VANTLPAGPDHEVVWHRPLLRHGLRAASPVADERPAVFVDKDGTLVADIPNNVDPSLLRFTPNAFEGLRVLRDAGFASWW